MGKRRFGDLPRLAMLATKRVKTMSVNCQRKRKLRCCVFCRSGSSSVSVAISQSELTYGSSPPQIGTWRRPSPRVQFVAIYFTVSTFFPALRERKEDIPLLVEYFIDHFARKAGKSFRGINKKTMALLLSYRWPGNIREVQNVIERSVIVCETENFSVDESWLSQGSLASAPTSHLKLTHKLAADEKEMIEVALRKSEGRVSGPSGAAEKLGISRSTLESKIRSLKIDKYHFKTARASKT